MTPMLSMHSQQTPNNRRLQAIMSTECKAACPGVEDMVKAMMKAQTGERRLGEGDEEADPKMMKLNCEHLDALKCSATTKACQDKEPTEEDAKGMEGLDCMCACPKLATIGEGMSKICEDEAGTVGCVASTSACAEIAKTMNEKEVGLMCEYASKGCQETMEDFMTCAGEDDMKVWSEKKCDEDWATTDTATCCPIAKKLLTCITKDCNTIQMAIQKMKADEGSAEDKKEVEKSAEARKACPDAGIPSEAAVSATASKGKISSGDDTDADSADFAAPGQIVSMLAMAAVIAASLMA
jgi:hypothetical protein